MEKKIIAVRNLRKALYFGGSMATFSAATGLAVAIPLYNKIQDELRKNFSKLADLSGFMTQLISKLGVSDASFTKELANGFQVVYENGKTKIFKTVNGEKTLVMNTNADGTIGSAARYDGVAAKQIISVVNDAVSMMGSDANAMAEILGPIAEEAEQTSVEIESAITGTPKEVLLLRNKVAGKTPDEINAAIASGEIAATPQQLADAKAAADKAKQEADAFKTMDEAQRAQAQKDELAKADEDTLKIAYIKYLSQSKSHPITSDDDAKADPLFSRPVAEVQALFSQEQSRRAAESASSAQEKTTAKAIESGPSVNLINNILSSPARFMNIFARTFGYHPTSGADHAGTSGLRQAIYNGLGTAFQNKQALLDYSYNQWTNLIGNQLLGYSSTTTNWNGDQPLARRKIQATTIVNTMNSLTANEKGLIVMSVRVTLEDGTSHNGFVVGHVRPVSSTILDWDSMTALFDFPINGKTYPQEKLDAVRYLSRIASSDVHPLVKKEAIQALIKISQGAQVNAIKDPDFVTKLNMFSSHLSSLDAKFIKNFFSTITYEVSKNTLYHERKYNFDVQEFIDATKLATEHDLLIDQSLANIPDDVQDNPNKYFGSWMNNLDNFINEDHADYDAYISHLANFYKLVSADTVPDELDAIMKSSSATDFNIISQDSQAVMELLTTTDVTLKAHVAELFKHGFTRDVWYHLTEDNIGKPGKVPTFTAFVDHIKQLMALDATKVSSLIDTYPTLVKHMLISDETDITDDISKAISIQTTGTYTSILRDDSFNHFFIQKDRMALELLTSTNPDVVKLLGVKKNGALVITPEMLYHWTQDIGTTGHVATYDLFKKHIKQMMDHINAVDATNPAITGIQLIKTNWKFVHKVLTSTKDDITFEVQDAVKLMQLNPNFDMNQPDNIQKVQAASGVSQALSSHTGLAAADVDAISDKVRAALTVTGTQALTPEEFKQVVEYTNTVFSVFSDTDEAVAQLKKVLDPKELKANVAKITKFNKWIEEIKKTHTGSGPITQKEIEDYVWTYKGMDVYDLPTLPNPWPDNTRPFLLQIIPTPHDGLLSVMHPGGGMTQIQSPMPSTEPTFAAPFQMNTYAPLGGTYSASHAFTGTYSSNGRYFEKENVVVSSTLKLTSSTGKITIWDLTHKTSKVVTIKNLNGVEASYIRNIIVTDSGKIFLIDEGGSIFTLSRTLTEISSSTFDGNVALQAMTITGGSLQGHVWAVGQYVKDGVTYGVISDATDGTTFADSKITVINFDTKQIVSQTSVSPYFYALSVDQKNGYAYGISANGKKLWRLDILHPDLSEELLDVGMLKDQTGASGTLSETGDNFRGIFYDLKNQNIVIASPMHIAWINDNTNELKEIFTYLMTH